MTISIFGHRHPLMWVDQSESWFPAKHAHVRRHQTQHILCQQRLSYLRSTSNYFLVVAWFFYFFIEKADFFSKIQTFWRKRRPYLCVFFKKVLFADQSPLKRTQLVSLRSEGHISQGPERNVRPIPPGLGKWVDCDSLSSTKVHYCTKWDRFVI